MATTDLPDSERTTMTAKPIEFEGYTITEEVDDGYDPEHFLALRDPDGNVIVTVDEEHGQWWLDGSMIAGYEFRNIALTSKDAAQELLMIIASLLPAPVAPISSEEKPHWFGLPHGFHTP